MTTSIIVATGRNNAIGAGGDLAFHISADLRNFKTLTMGKPVIMGRKTFDSLPNGALPGRRNIVITRNPSFCAPSVETASSLNQALEMTVDAAALNYRAKNGFAAANIAFICERGKRICI